MTTLYIDAPTAFITAAGTRFAYRELGPRGGVPLVLLNHWGAVLDNFDPAIIDELVQRTSTVVPEELLRERGIYSRALDDGPFNDFVASLSISQRNLLADICRRERLGGIHEALAVITWWIDCRSLTISIRGEALPIGQSGEGMQGDYIGRLNDWAWPGSGG